jgi:hypothetical protein
MLACASTRGMCRDNDMKGQCYGEFNDTQVITPGGHQLNKFGTSKHSDGRKKALTKINRQQTQVRPEQKCMGCRHVAWCQALEAGHARHKRRTGIACIFICGARDQTPYAMRAPMRGHEIKSEETSKAKGWKWWLARTFAAAGRTLAVDLQVARRADAKAAYGVAVAVAGASARHLDEVIPPAHPAHLPQLLLAEQPRTGSGSGSSVRRGHVSRLRLRARTGQNTTTPGHRLI